MIQKDISVLGEGPTQGLDNTSIRAEAKYSINLKELGKRFVLSMPYNESNSFLFVNATKMYQFKVKDSEIKIYNNINNSNIINIQEYLIKKSLKSIYQTLNKNS